MKFIANPVGLNMLHPYATIICHCHSPFICFGSWDCLAGRRRAHKRQSGRWDFESYWCSCYYIVTGLLGLLLHVDLRSPQIVQPIITAKCTTPNPKWPVFRSLRGGSTISTRIASIGSGVMAGRQNGLAERGRATQSFKSSLWSQPFLRSSRLLGLSPQTLINGLERDCSCYS
jgi:hypothetical protein